MGEKDRMTSKNWILFLAIQFPIFFIFIKQGKSRLKAFLSNMPLRGFFMENLEASVKKQGPSYH